MKVTKPAVEGLTCEVCGQPLFLDKKECKEFVEGKLKQGYIVCSCCGSEKKSQVVVD